MWASDPIGGKDLDTSPDLSPQLSFPFGHSSAFSGKGKQGVSFRSVEKGQLCCAPVVGREWGFSEP